MSSFQDRNASIYWHLSCYCMYPKKQKYKMHKTLLLFSGLTCKISNYKDVF